MSGMPLNKFAAWSLAGQNVLMEQDVISIVWCQAHVGLVASCRDGSTHTSSAPEQVQPHAVLSINGIE